MASNASSRYPGRKPDAAGLLDVSSVRIHLLGTFRITAGGRVIDETGWRLRKARSLVKLLALAPRRRLHREQIVEWLWPSGDPDTAANNLRSTLYVARRMLGGSKSGAPSLSIESVEDALVLTSTTSLVIDVETFETAAAAALRSGGLEAVEAALDLYTGELLPEDRYEAWVVERQATLDSSRISLLLEMARLSELRGEPHRAIAALQQVIDADPWREPAHAGLMRLYAATGQRGRALRQYHQLDETLRRDLQIEPDPASRRLYQQILEGRVSSELRPAGPAAPPASAPARQRSQLTNLPLDLDTLIGREREIADIRAALDETRLVTLIGPAGVGKTRLALRVAAGLARDVPDGVWLVELAPVSDAGLIAATAADALGLRGRLDRPAMDWLRELVAERRMLIVLDNCEHLSDACAAFVEQLLLSGPGLRILATSREALRARGERIWLVPPLRAPGDVEDALLSGLLDYDAVRLFVERATFARSDFEVDEDSAPVIARICRRLDGLPLAIELAAARVRSLPVGQILARLDGGLELLSGGRRTAPPRQQTLRGAIDWSHELLSGDEQWLFRRLSVFAGGARLAAVEAVCPDAAFDVDAALGSLVEKSLVQMSERGDEARYRLLEPVRQYAAERLDAAGDSPLTRQRHQDWCLAFARQAAGKIQGIEGTAWLEQLDREHDNFRAALSWAASAGGDGRPAALDGGLGLAAALEDFWTWRGHLDEGREWLAQLLRLAAPDPRLDGARAEALGVAGKLARQQGDFERARAMHAESLNLQRRMDDRLGVANSLKWLAIVAREEGDFEEARRLGQESLALARLIDDPLQTATSVVTLGMTLRRSGELEQAQALYEEALALYQREANQDGIAGTLAELAQTLASHGDYDLAVQLAVQSVDLHREIGDRAGLGLALWALGRVKRLSGELESAAALLADALETYFRLGARHPVARLLEELAAVASAEGDHERTAYLLGAADGLSASIQAPVWPVERANYERLIAAARAGLGDDAFEHSWSSGRALRFEQAVDAVLDPI